ncbi:Hypothetical Protein RradSPS_2343 [Rubrobacter radiotolerans]|uniref:Gram-positive cocci surface proteins LPxTG domain-containing protein n=1 Tax=Rubrobacter radiotolerans TaxID=42256 RepID=A0A023X611_RUBRA|nr:LPXTG cell wall anchor domain-containing protein [Rubrobacter radiotolerans]AHY47626.1 Hypothetical Protein RradSPS_2343 [Rubrobacter radiotolerans]
MKKVMLLGAMLAMVLTVAAPAVAQDNNSINNSGNTNVQYQEQDCSVIIEQYNQAIAGDAIASGDGAVAETAAVVNAPISVVQNCVQAGGDAVGAVGGNVAVPGDDGKVYYDDKGEVVYYDDAKDVYHYQSGEVVHEVYDDSGAVVYTHDSGAAAAASDVYSVLPDTGGASLIALGAGALLVAGGLLARRIVR